MCAVSLRSGAEKSADAVGGRSDFFDDFLEFLDHLARFAHRLLLVGNFRPQIEQSRRTGSPGGSEAMTRSNASRRLSASRVSRPRPQVPRCARRSLWFGSIRRTEYHYNFIRRIRNIFTRETLRSSTRASHKMFNHRLRRKFQDSSTKQNSVRKLQKRLARGERIEIRGLEFYLGVGVWN